MPHKCSEVEATKSMYKKTANKQIKQRYDLITHYLRLAIVVLNLFKISLQQPIIVKRKFLFPVKYRLTGRKNVVEYLERNADCETLFIKKRKSCIRDCDNL